jgi:ATP-dependent Clp protease ATP-binding subunit ClpA
MLILMQVQKFFKPEFLNRLSELVIFKPLSINNLRQIVKIQMNSVVAIAVEKGISVLTSEAALGVILSESYNPVSTTFLQTYCTIKLSLT